MNIDLNECEQYHPCNQNSVCINKLGSYQCECLKGFQKLTDNSNECYGGKNIFFSIIFIQVYKKK